MAAKTATNDLIATRSSYFGRIVNAVRTIIEGMSVTLSYLIQRPITIQYPDRTEKPLIDTLPDRTRGILSLDLRLCSACLACQRACPIGCIQIEVEKDKETKKRYMTRFDIDVAKCMYCGLCSEPCPTAAIHHTKEFEGSTQNPADFALIFIKEGERIEVAKVEKKKPDSDAKPGAKAKPTTAPTAKEKPGPKTEGQTEAIPEPTPQKKPDEPAEANGKPKEDET